MFVGQDRKLEVLRLTRLIDDVRKLSEPRMVVYVAPPGWGKTRIVQEFYRHLAGQQPAPSYWPSSLEPGHTTDSAVVRLTTSRKTVSHRNLTIMESASIPWVWLAPTTGRISDGSPAPALDSLIAQLIPHLPHLLRRLDATGARPDATYEKIASAVPLAELAKFAVNMGGVGSALLEAALAEHRRLATQLGRDAADYHRSVKLCELLGALCAPESGATLPIVVVLDDAHDIDRECAAFITEILASSLPVLILATTWPVALVRTVSPSPGRAFLAEAGSGDRLTRVVLGRLQEDDLIEYLLTQYPDTDPQIATRLAHRADGNPYALRLLLNTPRVVAAARNGRLELDATEIDELSGGLERLLSEHWNQLPLGVRQILVAASLLGESFHEDVLEEALRQITPEAGLAEAIASAWIQPTGRPRGLIEFIEHIRFEIARADSPNVLSPDERARVRRSALHAVKNYLKTELTPSGSRQAMLALHLALGEAGIETDLSSVAATAAELGDQARREHRRTDAIRYVRLAIQWTEQSPTPDWQALALFHLALVTLISSEYRRKTAEPEAIRLLKIADRHLDDEWKMRARCALARARRGNFDPDDGRSSAQLLGEAEQLATRTNVSAAGRRDLLTARYLMAGFEGRRREAMEILDELASYCDEHFGVFDRRSLTALEDFAYYALRAGHLDRALEARREMLHRRVQQSPEVGYVQTAPARTNLAFTLLEFNDDDLLPEAEQLITESLTLWSRAFGFDGKRAQRARLLRTRLWLRQGLALERNGDTVGASALFDQAASDTARVLELRRDAEPSSHAIALLRHGTARACQRERDALVSIGDAMDLRRDQLGQDASFWEMQRCAEILQWTYDRLGRHTEATSIRNRYHLPQGGDVTI